MKKINVKVTVFLSVIVLAVIILLLNFIEFRKTLDFTALGIRMLKENASGKQEEVQVDVSGTYSYRVLPWIYASSFNGKISFAGEGEEPQDYFFLYGGRKGVFQSGRGAGQILTPDMSTCAAIYEAVQGVEKGMISATANSAEENQIFYILYPATTLEEAYEISDVLYPGMLGK